MIEQDDLFGFDLAKFLVVVVHDGTDQLAGVHLAMSEEEAEAVCNAMASVGPVWRFPFDPADPIQWYGG